MAGITAAVIGAGASVLSTGVSAISGGKGASQQGAASKEAAMYNAQVARNNATIARQNADYVGKAGMIQASDASMKTGATVAKITTAQGASGVDVNTGSAVDVQAGAREVGKKDAETVQSNAAVKAYGYRVQGANYDAQANLDEMGGQAAETAAGIKSQGSILSGITSLAGQAGGLLGKLGGGGNNADKVTGTMADATAAFM